MLSADEYTKIIMNAFPPNLQARIAQNIQLAYSAADQTIEESNFLNWPIGYNLIGYLRNASVEFSLKRLANSTSGRLNCSIRTNEKKNCNHIELQSNGCILTVSQVHSPFALPRKAVYRNELAVSNQLMMDEFDVDGMRNCERPNKTYLILTHGCRRNVLGQTPSFIGIGFPSPDSQQWYDFVDLTSYLNRDFIVVEDAAYEAEELLKINLLSQIEVLTKKA